MWLEVCKLAFTIEFKDEEDALIWCGSSLYSTQSVYKIMNFRGVQQVFVSAV